jgi:signal peptidase II
VTSEPNTPDPSTDAGPPLPKRRAGIVFVVLVLGLAVDLISKQLVVANLEGKPPVKLLGGLFYLDVIRNPGAAFSMASGMTWVFSIVAAIVVVAIVWLAPKLRSVGWAIGLGLVLAGALGNLLDRLFRAPGPLEGHVVDFISPFKPWGEGFAVFNGADSCITIGGILIVLLAVLGKDYDGGVGKRRKEAGLSAASASDAAEKSA